jgi:hypothetical protein
MRPIDDSEGNVFSSHTTLQRLVPIPRPRFQAYSKLIQNYSIFLWLVAELEVSYFRTNNASMQSTDDSEGDVHHLYPL